MDMNDFSTLKIEYIDAQWDDPLTTKVETPVFTDEDTSELDGLHETYGRFLHFAGYPQFSNDYTFVKSVNGDEFDLLDDVLKAIRKSDDTRYEIIGLLQKLNKE